jgi:hypothetical protein
MDSGFVPNLANLFVPKLGGKKEGAGAAVAVIGAGIMDIE